MRTKIALGMLTIYLVWGSTYLAIRFGIETIPPFLLASCRFFTAGTILFLLRWHAGDPLPSKRQWLSAAGIELLMLLCGNGLITWSELRIDSGIAALLGGTVPIWMVLIDTAFLKKNKPNQQKMLGLIVGF
jgi:drug/metabolite transporter (DMT)-like permease